MENKLIYKEIGKDKMYNTWHSYQSEVMLLFCYSDGGNVVSHEKVFPLNKNSLFFVGENTSHYTIPDIPSKYERSKIFIKKDTFNILLECLSESGFKSLFQNNTLIGGQLSEEDAKIVENLLIDANKQSDTDIFIAILLSVTIRLLSYIKQFSTQNETPKTNDNIAKAITFINERIRDKITIDDIANASYLSKYHFCRKFKDVIGVTVMEYLLLTRLSLAKSKLTSTNLSITEISESLGFSSVSYFSNIFKKHFGETPLAYRKNNK